MNIESKIIYATLGSFITLVCVFTFKLVFISDTLIPATTKSAEIHQECPTSFTDLENDEFIEEVYSDKQVSEVNIAPKNNDLFEKTTKYCDDLCVNNLINELTTNNDEDIIISSEQANLISSTLLENPNKLAEIENKLSSLKDQNSRDSILYIYLYYNQQLKPTFTRKQKLNK